MTPDELARVVVWAGSISREELAHVSPGVRLKELKRGEHLLHLDDRVDAWHGAISGVLRVGMISND